MLGALDGGEPGVSVGTLKSRMGSSGSTTLTGTITDESGNAKTIEIKITAELTIGLNYSSVKI